MTLLFLFKDEVWFKEMFISSNMTRGARCKVSLWLGDSHHRHLLLPAYFWSEGATEGLWEVGDCGGREAATILQLPHFVADMQIHLMA